MVNTLFNQSVIEKGKLDQKYSSNELIGFFFNQLSTEVPLVVNQSMNNSFVENNSLLRFLNDQKGVDINWMEEDWMLVISFNQWSKSCVWLSIN